MSENPYDTIAKLLGRQRQEAQANPLLAIARDMPTSMDVIETKGHNPKWWEYLAASIAPALARGIVQQKGQSQVDSKLNEIASSLKGLRGAEDKQQYLMDQGMPEAAMAFAAQDYAREQEKQAQIQQYELQKNFDPVFKATQEQRALDNDFRTKSFDADQEYRKANLGISRSQLGLSQQEMKLKKLELEAKAISDLKAEAYEMKQEATDFIKDSNKEISSDESVKSYKELSNVYNTVVDVMTNPDISENTKNNVALVVSQKQMNKEALNEADIKRAVSSPTLLDSAKDYLRSIGGVNSLAKLRGSFLNQLNEQVQNTRGQAMGRIIESREIAKTSPNTYMRPDLIGSSVEKIKLKDIATALKKAQEKTKTDSENKVEQKKPTSPTVFYNGRKYNVVQ